MTSKPHYFAILLIVFALFPSTICFADDWPHWGGPGHDGIWRETGIVKTLKGVEPKFKWRMPINKGYTGPAVVDGKLYVMDRTEEKAKPDDAPKADDGSARKKQKGAAQRGLPTIPGKERILCLNASTGKEI